MQITFSPRPMSIFTIKGRRPKGKATCQSLSPIVRLMCRIPAWILITYPNQNAQRKGGNGTMTAWKPSRPGSRAFFQWMIRSRLRWRREGGEVEVSGLGIHTYKGAPERIAHNVNKDRLCFLPLHYLFFDPLELFTSFPPLDRFWIHQSLITK